MRLQTIISKDRKLIAHGTVIWKNNDEFGFVPQGKRLDGQLWCKLDYWELTEGEPAVWRSTARLNPHE